MPRYWVDDPDDDFDYDSLKLDEPGEIVPFEELVRRFIDNFGYEPNIKDPKLDFVHFNSGFVGCFISRSGFIECIVDSMMFEKSDSFPLAYFIEVESKCTKSS
jgi:hypothetical protein